MNFRQLLESANSVQDYDIEKSIFDIDADGLPFLSFSNGRKVYGLNQNRAFKRRYAKEKPHGQTLEEFSIRQDFPVRYAKKKLTRRFACKPGDTIVEVGAYLGYHSMKVADIIGESGQLIAIEMVEENFEVLRRNLEDNYPNTCKAIRSAIAENEGTFKAYLGGSQANGLRNDVIATGRREAHMTTVRTRRLDNLLSEIGVDQIDLLSLQLNGTELDVIKTLPSSFFKNVKAVAVAANYDRTIVPVSHEIAEVLDGSGYDVEIYDNWVYALRRKSGNLSVRSLNPVFIGGCGRSGTTLMRVILDSHSKICCGPESNILAGPNLTSLEALAAKFDFSLAEVLELASRSAYLPQFCSTFFGTIAERHGKSRWAEKTPKNITRLKYIFDNFPNARVLHVVRDGRDVACSLRTHPKFKTVGGKLEPTNIERDFGDCIQRWVEDVTAGLIWDEDPRVYLVKYEDLVARTEDTMRSVLAFLGAPWDPAVLAHHAQSTTLRDSSKFPNNAKANSAIVGDSVGRWRQCMSNEQREEFRSTAGALLVKLGYESNNDWV